MKNLLNLCLVLIAAFLPLGCAKNASLAARTCSKSVVRIIQPMKLNSLIKYNSLKIFSLLGYLLFIAIIYFQFIALPAAAKIDKIAGCHFDADFPMCKGNDVEIISFIIYFAIAFLGILCLIAAFFEFLWKKYKSKNKTERKYPIFVIILFWIGMVIEIFPYLLFLWITLFVA